MGLAHRQLTIAVLPQRKCHSRAFAPGAPCSSDHEAASGVVKSHRLHVLVDALRCAQDHTGGRTERCFAANGGVVKSHRLHILVDALRCAQGHTEHAFACGVWWRGQMMLCLDISCMP
eukprot:scaffold166893_cov17-Tisochrysis_lutea.AAC.2